MKGITRARLVGVALIVLVMVAIVAIVATGGAAAVAENETATNETANETVSEPVDSGPYDRDELTRGGSQVTGADPSMRWIDDGSVFVDYPSADPLKPQADEWEVENILAPGALVERDELTINAQRERGADDTEIEVVVVHWQEHHVVDDNGTVHTVATNQSETSHTAEINGAFDHETINLPNTDGERYQVAMWLEEDGEEIDGARWTFEHESAPTSVDAGISTQGDLFAWAGLNIVAPLLFGIPASLYGGSKILDKTGRGPDIPTIFYASMIVLGALIIALFAWQRFTTVITHLPLILAGFLTAIAFVGYLEYGSNDVVRAQFVREELMDATSPTGDDVHDVLYQEIADIRLVRTDDDGRYVVVESGIMPFLARLIGVAPSLDISELSTQIKAKGDKWDKIFVADPTADGPIDYEAPSLKFPLSDPIPESNDESSPGALAKLAAIRWTVVASTILGGVFGWIMGPIVFGLASLGLVLGTLIGFAGSAARVDAGHVEFTAAPVHYTQARQTLSAAQSEYDDAATLEEMEEIAWTERARTALDARRVQSHMDSTVTEQLAKDELGLSEDPRDDAQDGQDNDETRDSQRETDETAMVPADDD